jgi:hypothetical protein
VVQEDFGDDLVGQGQHRLNEGGEVSFQGYLLELKCADRVFERGYLRIDFVDAVTSHLQGHLWMKGAPFGSCELFISC